jgi:tetratricopeptide (TPR) repeat protein
MSEHAGEEFDSRSETQDSAPVPLREDARFSLMDRTGQKVGPCTLRQLIGTGGMGAVYEAVQENPRRTVAIKLMRRGIVSRSALRRFEFESQILARLRHPGIAQVYGAGTHVEEDEETPYFIMEYIPGAEPITEYAARQDLSIKDRMALFRMVCDAVQHGHLKGIVHRDLKPANILISSNGQPKVIDFGVARSTDSDLALTTLQTDVGQILGTLQYMSPEQCAADPNDIDTRSDVYALGVVLHELLTGQMPYDVGAAALHEAVRIIREDSPARLSTIDRRLKGDLETITGKALEKERGRRYQSASALADDIGHWLADEPIKARPPSAIDMLIRFARRHTAAAIAISAVFLTLIVTVTITTISAVEASRQREIAQEAQIDQVRQREAAVSVKDFLKEMIANVDPVRSGRIAEAGMSEMLVRASERIDQEFADQPELQAELRTTLGDTWTGIGLYDQGLKEYQVAFDLREELYGAESKEALLSKGRLGRALDRMGRQDEAIEMFTQQIEGMSLVVSRGDPDLLKAKIDLSGVHRELGRFAEAEVLLTEVIDGSSIVSAEHSNLSVSAKVAMGQLVMAQGDPTAGEQWFVDALADLDQMEGVDHVRRQSIQYNVAISKAIQNQTEEAIVMLRQLLEDRESTLGPDHPQTLATAGTLGGVLANSGDLAAAEPHFQRVYDGQLRMLGAEHPNTLSTLSNLGNMQMEQGKFELGYASAQMGLAAAMRTRGLDDPTTCMFQRLMARVLIKQEKYEEAQELAQLAVDGAVSVYGENSGETTLALDMLLQVLDAKGDTEGAEAVRARVKRILESNP